MRHTALILRNLKKLLEGNKDMTMSEALYSLLRKVNKPTDGYGGCNLKWLRGLPEEELFLESERMVKEDELVDEEIVLINEEE